MKKISLIIFIIISLSALTKRSLAQAYQVAAGVKFGGYENGFSGKYFIDPNTALEGILGIRDHGVVLTGLYELHQTAFGVKELKFYYGAGAHLGAIGSGVYQRYNGSDVTYNNSHVLLGADGVIGLEYMIPKSPIAISLDLNPRAELGIGPYFDIAPGLGIKYMFMQGR